MVSICSFRRPCNSVPYSKTLYRIKVELFDDGHCRQSFGFFICLLVTCFLELVSHLGIAREETKSATVCRLSRGKVWLGCVFSEVKKEASFSIPSPNQINLSFETSTKLLIPQCIQSYGSDLSPKIFFVHNVLERM
jgi:hypothetical protein